MNDPHEESPSPAEGPAEKLDFGITLIGGGVFASTLFAVLLLVGRGSAAEAHGLLQSAVPAIRFLSSSMLTVGATVMALMLTLLGFSESTEHRFRRIHYDRIHRISLFSMFSIVLAVGLLLLMGIPLEESETLRSLYEVVYFVFLGGTSLLGGLAVTVVLMLHRTITGLTHALSPGDHSSPLVRDPD